jgi:hypothetical protein
MPLVEAGTALALTGWWWRLGESWQTAGAAALTCLAIAAAVIGIERLTMNRGGRTYDG